MIVVKIDCDLIDKTKLFTGREKNGHTPKYLDLVLFENKNGEDRYGNTHIVCQSLSKEERAAGKKGAILGNAKIVGPPRQVPEPEINRMRNPGGIPGEDGGPAF